MERSMQKQLYGISRESSPSVRRQSMPVSADNTRKSYFGGNQGLSPRPGSLKKTALNNR